MCMVQLKGRGLRSNGLANAIPFILADMIRFHHRSRSRNRLETRNLDIGGGSRYIHDIVRVQKVG